MNPPNRAYALTGPGNTPREMQYDLAKLSPNLRCPKDGGQLARIGSSGFYNVRCMQCGEQDGLAGPQN
jgi:hypothetical protein